ncbi:AMP-dependent synthetase and ligase (plasmid) [Gemmatirosa kalamazoonensis]|uniref:AMP-dependent synthetase and ligase n=1 Tax=Gemmatirosa kalamazoonensis TaxID=861299 RepID=W0RS15_9BACT|nr:AMP-binding protein [Gemmatirosa kalamazoonensis]AHG93115.1 AMP-dependent synthetase and ligase [Gemmatirosa kalamazoonensis]
MTTGHVDTFCADNLPPRELWPVRDWTGVPELAYPARLNCAAELLDRMVATGHADRVALRWPGGRWTYAELLETSNRIANVLVNDLGLVPGNRVLLRGPNAPMLAASWLAVAKAGGVVVCTMPLLREREIHYIAEKANVHIALSDARVAPECDAAFAGIGTVTCYGTDDGSGLERLMRRAPSTFGNCDTAADDIALIAFTSGSTGQGKGTMHEHRDVLAITDCFPRYVLQPDAEDVFCGSPPLGFTYALGGLLLFPLRVGASALLLEQASPPHLAKAIAEHRPTVCFTAPTAYRAMCGMLGEHDVSSLRKCVSAGETLPRSVFDAWKSATGLDIIDGIGATEMLHIFISASGADIRPGSTGRVVPGYEARVVDDDGDEVPDGTVGHLAVRGPTGCRYLANPDRQREYVRDGWNFTGDSYRRDADGYFWYQARTDDIIVSAGYNIAGPEVENVLLEHPAVAECAVIGVPDEERGHIVKAVVVLRGAHDAGAAMAAELQEFVKARIAPYKYPRAVEFAHSLPRTSTGKLQRYRLRGGEPRA